MKGDIKMAKKTNDEKIIAAMDSIDKAVRMLERYGARYDEHIDAAALRGDDARAKQLIKQKHKVYALASQLNTLKMNIELGAYTAQAISQLGKLPEAIAGCKGLLAETPDFTKLGKSITAIFKDMEKSESEIAKLNEILEPQPVDTIASRLDGTSVSEEENTDWFKAEYAAMIERIKPSVTPEMVTKPDIEDSTGDIDYEGIIEDEKKKK